MRSLRGLTAVVLLVGGGWLQLWPLSALAAEDTSSLPTGKWLSSTFNSPEDGQPWHSVFYVAAVKRPQLITRHSGLLIRCTDAPVTNNLKLAFAFGAVLRTNSVGEVGVDIALDGRSVERLRLVTRNQANAEFADRDAKSFLLRLMTANTLQFKARLSPKGRASVDIPLGPGKSKITDILNNCGIDLATDVRLASAQKESAQKESAQKAAEDAQDAKTATSLPPLARAVSSYLAANNADELAAGSKAIALLQPSASELIAALQAPDALSVSPSSRPGPGEVGVSRRQVDGLELPFYVSVPAGKTPDEGSPLALVLHGGVQRPPWREREGWWQDYPFNYLLRDFLVVSPAGWRDAKWWDANQEQNLSELIAQMQRHYRVDESRVFVIGVSDGAAGAMNLAMNNATPLAGVVSLIGHPAVLFENDINPDAQPQFANLSQVPLFIANGGADPTMPPNTLAPWLESMRTLKVQMNAHTEEGMGHTLEFAGDVYAEIGQFLREKRRELDPVELAWEANAAHLPARNRWLVIESLLPGAETGCIQARRLPDGSYSMQTQGVAKLRVLINHGADEPRRLVINPEAAESQMLTLDAAPSMTTLLRWHAEDASRAEFFSTEHLVKITSETQGLCRSPIAHTIVAEAAREELIIARKRRADRLRSANSGGASQRNDAPGISSPRNSGPGIGGSGSDRGRSRGDPTRITRPGERR